MVRMRAGKLRDRVAFESPDGTTDSYGNPSDGWGNSRTVWADVRERTGKEKMDAGAVAAVRMATVRIRKNSTTEAITTSDRVTIRGELWNIRSIAQIDSKGAMLEMTCEAGVAA